MVSKDCEEERGKTQKERVFAGESSSEICLTSRTERGCLTETGNLFWDLIQPLF